MAKFTGGTTPIDLFDFDAELQDLDDGTTASIYTATQLRRDEAIPTDYVDFFGTKFTYDGSFNLIPPSTVTRIVSFANTLQWDLSGISLSDAQLDGFITAGNGQAFLSAVLGGNDSITGSTGNDTLQGFAGNDSFNGGKGDDVYHVDDNKDVVTESLTFAAGGGIDLVISKGTFTLGTNVDNLQLENGKNADGTGNAINNTLTGNAQDNKLTGLAGDDLLVGNAGNDTLDGGTNTATVGDTMVGGEGDDLYVVDSAKDQVTESGANVGLGDELKTNQNTLLAPLLNIEHYTFTGTTAVNFIGDAASNRITGAAAADNLQGGSGNGNDTLIGLAGNDSLNGFGGDDVLDGGAGIDEMRGGTGNDIYVVDNAKDLVSEGVATDANDTVRASITVTLASFVGIENIELTGTGALNATGDGLTNNKLTGNAGANKLDGLGGDDTMDGGKGNDTYVVDSTTDQVAETDVLTGGLDTVLSSKTFTLTGAIENLTLTALGPTLDIDAFGNALVNTLTGNDGKNVLDGGALADKLLGGKGDDTYIVDDLKDTVTESVTFAAGGGIDLVKSAVTFTLGTNLDKLELTGTAKIDGTGNTLDNTLTGNGEANKLSGLAGADSLLGNGGNDTLDGGTNTAAAGDTLEGGLGDDLYIVDSALDVVNPDTGGTDELKTNQQFVPLIAGIENYTFTGTKAVIFDASNDSTKNKITGTAAADTFDAKGGDDSVAGLAGNDTLTGGAGNDSLDGGAGTDSMDGGAGDDSYTIDNIKDAIADSGGTDTVVASVSFDLSAFKAGIENASLTGTAALNLTGDDFVNKLIGNAGANKIDGKGGADDMIGGAGSDTYTVDNLGDKVTETDSKGGTDLVLSSVDFTLGAFLENLTLTDIKDVNGKVTNDVDGTGNELANLITGNGAANILKGGATDGNDTTPNGNDTLIGNGGDDSLSGGAGADSLSGGDGNDTLDGGAGAAKSDFEGDKMAGGAGDDVYFVNTSKDTVTEAAGAAGGLHDTVKTTVGHTLGANVEDMVLLKETTGLGNGLNNIITGSEVTDTADDKSGDDFINGFAGNDTLLGMGGDDELVGNTGNDSIDGGDGIDIVQFTGKIDDYEISVPDEFGRFTVKDLKAAVNGNDGTDTLINVERLIFFGTKVPVTFDVHAQGTDGPDTVPLTSAPDGFDGLKGDDSIDGDGGADTLEGNEGNDTLIGGTGDDQLKGGTGADQYNHAGTSVDGNDVVSTGDATTTGLDKLVFTGANLFDLGFTRDGNNLIVGAVKSGQTTFDGQVLVVDHYNGAAIASVVIDTQFNGFYGTDPNQATFVFTTDLDSGVNNADYTEVLLGSDKSDLINGNGGFLDILVGNAGNDTLNGGTGTNVVDYRAAEAGVTLSLLAGKATVDGDGGQDTLLNIQNVRGSQFDDDITGDGGDNVLEGGKGNDALNGGEGRDQVVYTGGLSAVTINLTDGTASGGTSVGEDSLDEIERVLGSQFSDTITGKLDIFAELTGSKGNDTIDGAGNGYASYYDSPAAVTANLATGTATDGWGTTDKLTLNSLVGLSGSDFNDTLTGNTANNWFEGGKGNDSIDGGGGTADVVDYSKSTAGITVDLGAGTAKDGFGGTDTLKNLEWVTGSAFNDTITGSSAANSFTGGAGNDSLVGGTGIDTAVFSGDLAGYLVTFDGKGGATVKDTNLADGNDGTDTVTGIEFLQFADQTAPVDQPPDITSGAAFSLAENTTTVGTITATDPDAGDKVTFSISGTDSAFFNIDAGTGALTFKAAPNFEAPADAGGNNIYDLTVTAKDTAGLVDTQNITVTVTNVNEAVGAVSDTNAAGDTVAENATTGTLVGITAFAADPDAGQTVSYSLTKDESLGGFKIDATTGIVTVDNGALLDFDTDASHVITVKATSTDGSSSTKDFTITLTNVNEPIGAVSDTNAAGDTVAENATTGTLVGITAFADDPDAGQNVSYSLTKDESGGGFKIDATTGVVTVNDGSKLDFDTDSSHVITVKATSTDGSSSTKDFTITLTNVNEPIGAVSDTNAAGDTVAENATTGTLVGITAFADDPDAGQNVSYSLTKDESGGGFKIDATTGIVTVDDGSKLDFDTDASQVITVKATSTDGSSSTKDFTITLTNVSEPIGAVSDTNAAGDTVAENATTGTLVGITAFADDPDAGQTVSYSLTKDESGGGFKIDATTGVVTVDNGALLDFDTDASHVITVKATSTDGSSSTKDFTIALTNVNEPIGAVSDTNAAGDTVAENATTGTLVGITAFADDPDAGQNVSYSLTKDESGGGFKIDATTGVVTVNDGSKLDFDIDASHVITVKATSTDGSSSTKDFTIALTNVNEPVGAVSDTNAAGDTVAENATTGTLVGITAFADDPDAGQNVSYSLTKDESGGGFKIDATTGIVTVDDGSKLDFDTDASHVITVKATSTDGSSSTKDFTIALTNVNEPIGAVSDTNAAGDTVAENATTGTLVGITAFADDPDAGQNVSYSLTKDESLGGFKIDATTGIVTVDNGALLDFDTDSSHVITVKATSTDGSSSTKDFTITLTNVNEPIGAVSDTNAAGDTVAENATTGTLVGITGFADDPDAGQNVSYSLTKDESLGGFKIDATTGIVTVDDGSKLDFDTDASHVITVKATSTDGSSSTKDFTITLTNVNEPVGAISDTNAAGDTVAENATTGTLVGITAFADDPDAGQTVSYSLTKDESGGGFKIDATTGIVTVDNGALLDFDTDASHVITVKATSTDGSSSTKDFTITLTNVNEPIGAVSDTNAAGDTVAENATIGTLVGITAFADDPDAGQNVSYSLTKDESLGGFKIDATTGIVTVSDGSKLDFDTDASHVITVKATSTDGSSSTKDFTITLTNVNEPVGAISDTNAAGDTVAENATTGTLVGITAFADDPDAGQNVSYSLTKDESLGGFKIDATTGIVTVDNGALLDFDTDASHVITVKATSTDGSSSTKDFTIALTNVNEPVGAISDTNAAGDTVAENATTGTLVGITAFADDPDAGQNVSYSLTKDESGGGLKIDATTGIVTVDDGSKLDFETDSSHIITVKATSTDGSSSTKDFTITLTDVIGETLDGDGNANKLVGGIGDDSLSGAAGDDTLIGGADNDSMTGGLDVDTFQFSLAASAGADTIADFDKASDVLRFEDVVDDAGDPGLDLADLHATALEVGSDVHVTFGNGASIVFQGAATGAVDSIDDLVANANTQIVLTT